jgi:hypothetical protein
VSPSRADEEEGDEAAAACRCMMNDSACQRVKRVLLGRA